MSKRKLPEVRFVRTVCPVCGSLDNVIKWSKLLGSLLVRHHTCTCAPEPGAVVFRSVEHLPPNSQRRRAKAR